MPRKFAMMDRDVFRRAQLMMNANMIEKVYIYMYEYLYIYNYILIYIHTHTLLNYLIQSI